MNRPPASPKTRPSFLKKPMFEQEGKSSRREVRSQEPEVRSQKESGRRSCADFLVYSVFWILTPDSLLLLPHPGLEAVLAGHKIPHARIDAIRVQAVLRKQGALTGVLDEFVGEAEP